MQSGTDAKGTTYKSIDQMWEIELNSNPTATKVIDRVGSEQRWYSKANEYWSEKDATYDAVLGGYGNLSAKDIKFSLGFLLKYVKEHPLWTRGSVLDCGAGIGRISKELLCQTFKEVDLVDQCEKYVEKAKGLLQNKIRHYYTKGLQEFDFEEKYDCVWVQWVISHLSDAHAVEFLRKAKISLNQQGVIFVKENHCKYGFVVDKDDFSVTRSTQLYKKIFQEAGLKVEMEDKQMDWPQDLFDVRMYALK